MLQQNPSGSYWNLSQGQFVTATRQDLPPPPVHLDATLAQGRLRLAWNSQEGSAYHVQAFDDTSGWFDVSAEIRAAGTTVEWIEAAPLASTRRLYRVRLVR